jgi:hypothetical protein
VPGARQAAAAARSSLSAGSTTAGRGLIDRYVFLDANGQGWVRRGRDRLRSAQPHVVSRDRAVGGLFITDPTSLRRWPDRLHGRAAFSKDGEVKGVVAADITLDGCRSTSPSTRSAQHAELRARPSGRVLAASDLSRPIPPTRAGRLAPHQQSRFGAAAIAYGAHPRNGGDALYSFSYGRARYFRQPVAPAGRFRQALAALHRHAGSPTSPAPTTATTGCCSWSAWSRRRVALVVIYFLSGMLSAPLERLAAKVT